MNQLILKFLIIINQHGLWRLLTESFTATSTVVDLYDFYILPLLLLCIAVIFPVNNLSGISGYHKTGKKHTFWCVVYALQCIGCQQSRWSTKKTSTYQSFFCGPLKTQCTVKLVLLGLSPNIHPHTWTQTRSGLVNYFEVIFLRPTL